MNHHCSHFVHRCCEITSDMLALYILIFFSFPFISKSVFSESLKRRDMAIFRDTSRIFNARCERTLPPLCCFGPLVIFDSQSVRSRQSQPLIHFQKHKHSSFHRNMWTHFLLPYYYFFLMSYLHGAYVFVLNVCG